MSDKIFKLKEFNLHHSNSTMKVGTDAMILGAFATSHAPKQILDIGTGCGILALMMAQKYPESAITAIDIHPDSIIEAESNFQNSKFMNVSGLNTSLQEYSTSNTNQIDLIISNPPFFDQDLKSNAEDRNLARHNDHLSFEELIMSSAKLMHSDSVFWFILPSRYYPQIKNIAHDSKLFIKEEIHLKNDYDTAIRVVFCLTKTHFVSEKKEMNIRINKEYSTAYKELTKEYHYPKL